MTAAEVLQNFALLNGNDGKRGLVSLIILYPEHKEHDFAPSFTFFINKDAEKVPLRGVRDEKVFIPAGWAMRITDPELRNAVKVVAVGPLNRKGYPLMKLDKKGRELEHLPTSFSPRIKAWYQEP